MKKLALIALVASFTTAYAQDCRVVGVHDGDTLTCLTPAKQQIKVRLYGIDAPESNQAYGTASKNQLLSMVFGKNVTLEIKGTDRYSRTVADVKVNGKSANLAQVINGYAWAYRQYLKGIDQYRYVQAENEARAAKRGLWADTAPINPSDFRRGVKSGTYTTIITPAPRPVATITHPAASNNFTCGTKRYCAEMTSCAEAQFYLNTCGVTRLDRDRDGIACETLCR